MDDRQDQGRGNAAARVHRQGSADQVGFTHAWGLQLAHQGVQEKEDLGLHNVWYPHNSIVCFNALQDVNFRRDQEAVKIFASVELASKFLFLAFDLVLAITFTKIILFFKEIKI